MRSGALIAGLGAAGLAGAMWLALPSQPSGDTLSFVPEANAAAPLEQAGCPSLPGFAAFRDALGAALEERSADGLVAISHPGIELGTDGRAGIDEMRRELDDDARWSDLASLAHADCAMAGPEQVVLGSQQAAYRAVVERGPTGWRIDSLAPAQPSAASTS